ncbi:unnamed protein product [Schistosoma curassoni]|uniref:Uncharacterized protein n=1 Tax=Schistosoma curassoni TaxID=6186 RepID=A0A183L1Q5_9TREM|nr:unnamed protein product [Schistosoma curassoni]
MSCFCICTPIGKGVINCHTFNVPSKVIMYNLPNIGFDLIDDICCF